MTKPELLHSLNSEHRAILATIQHFSQHDFERAGAAGEWTATDVFGHLAFWNWEAKKAIEQVLRGERPAMMLLDNFDETNAREVAARRDHLRPDVMNDFRRSQKSLAALIERTPDAELFKPTAHKSGDGKDANAAWILGGIIEHYQEHAAALKSVKG